ncbi:hypothetical protein ACLKA7_010082 [Drosophila subpalustris]
MLLTGRGIGKALDSESLLLGTAAASHHWGCVVYLLRGQQGAIDGNAVSVSGLGLGVGLDLDLDLDAPSSSAMPMMRMMLALALIVTTAALLLRCGVYFNGSNGAALQQHATCSRIRTRCLQAALLL